MEVRAMRDHMIRYNLFVPGQCYDRILKRSGCFKISNSKRSRSCPPPILTDFKLLGQSHRRLTKKLQTENNLDRYSDSNSLKEESKGDGSSSSGDVVVIARGIDLNMFLQSMSEADIFEEELKESQS